MHKRVASWWRRRRGREGSSVRDGAHGEEQQQQQQCAAVFGEWEGAGGLLARAESRASRLWGAGTAHLGKARESHRDTSRGAEAVAADVNAHFDQVRQHHAALLAVLAQERKRSARRVEDPSACVRVLVRVARQAFGPCDGQLTQAHLGAVFRLAPVLPGPCAHAPRVVWGAELGARQARALFGRCVVLAVSSEGILDLSAVQGPSLVAQPPTLRAHHGTASTRNGHVYVVGGSCMYTPVTMVQRYHVASDSWQTLPTTLPGPMRTCGACVVNDRFLVVVGDAVGAVHRSAVRAFDIARGLWWELPPLPWGGTDSAVAAWGATAFVTGGRGRDGLVAEAWALDMAWPLDSDGGSTPQWRELPPMTAARWRHGSTAGAGRVFVCGGETVGWTSGQHTQSGFEALDVRLHGWAQLPPLPTALSQCGCCFGGGSVFVVGGINHLSSLGSVFAYSTIEGAWTTLPRLNFRREGCGAAVVGRRLFVFGGRDELAVIRESECFEF